MTSALIYEGYVRELIRQTQDMRKEAEYEVSDRIFVAIDAKNEVLKAVIKFEHYISGETLANKIADTIQGSEWDLEKELDIEGEKIKIALRR